MLDFRLKVFYVVAQRLSFTKAAAELFISQPAVSKHVKALEEHFSCRLFDRKGNRLALTAQGRLLKRHASEILKQYKALEAELSYSNQLHKGYLRIGASTTAAQYVLPQYLAQFKMAFPHFVLEVSTGNTEKIENLLRDDAIDLGVVEGESKRRSFDYQPLLKDEIVLCTRRQIEISPLIEPSQLRDLPFVFREQGSGTLEIIRTSLLSHQIKIDDLKTAIILENNESIKNYLLSSEAFAFISISAILRELKDNRLKIIDVTGLQMERYYSFLTKKGVHNDQLNLFKRFLMDNLRL